MESNEKMMHETTLENRGIDYIAESDRNSNPLNVFFVLGGAQLCFSVMIIGALPIVFGLGWWDAFFANTIGLFIGSLLIAPLALLGQKTGTNGPVSSGAHFGTKGRLIGASLTIFVALGFYGLTVWTGAQSLVYSGHKLFGWPEGDTVLVACSLILSIITSIVAIYGHSLVVMIEKIGAWICAAILVLAILVFLPDFNPSYRGGDYLLGGFWSTWLLSASVALSIPVSCATLINDYTRYIPSATKARSLMLGAGGGMFFGCWLGMNTAAYLTTMFANLETPLVQGIIELSPIWFVFPLLLVGLIGSLTQGCFALYGAGLGLETMGWGLNRIITTVMVSIVGLLLVLLIVFVYEITDIINAFVTLIIVAISPWLTINLVGYYLFKGQYSAQQLHETRGGLYWYSNGFNIPAMTAWVIAVVIGLLFTNTTVFVGPFVNMLGGVDVSFVSSAIVGAVIYYMMKKNSLPQGLEVGTVQPNSEESLL
ncbi:nitrate reductase [Bacillus sp. V3-13]|uniref:purine-cytosine permease family protein n=1 Tax=Bacillus sp. V3-13 TaxID=2053728 RepID=UPI000C76ED57|nr:cytosine permease [Bacillus sp. V3-13]PLR78350.1 nitrate reductase [Bacillus sp. V3-13]